MIDNTKLLVAKEPSYWHQAKQELCDNDVLLSQIIKNCSSDSLVSRGDAFGTLMRSIVGQQISVVAASAIWNRIEKKYQAITPENILTLGEDDLRSLGLTRRKSSYIISLAKAFCDGDIGLHTWNKFEDEEVIDALIKLRGIGRWTAEMFLIFYLVRPNVLPLADVGLRRAVSQLYKKEKSISDNEIIEIAELWHPWCSVATWYLWRSIDPEPVNY